MAGNTSTPTGVLDLAKLFYSPIDFCKRGADLSFSFFVIGGFQLAREFLSRELQRFDLPYELRILDRGLARSIAIPLEFVHALLDFAFVIDKTFAGISHG
jgi:hypothetical protein